MLVIIYGPTGVGKTSLMKGITLSLGAQMIPTIMTRPLRPKEMDKVAVTDRQFEELAAEDSFLHVNNIHGFRYGTPRQSIMAAVADTDTLHLIDFPIQNRDVFRPYKHRSIVLIPESIEQLVSQLTLADRANRVETAVLDFHHNYKHADCGDSEGLVLVNRLGHLQECVDAACRYLMAKE